MFAGTSRPYAKNSFNYSRKLQPDEHNCHLCAARHPSKPDSERDEPRRGDAGLDVRDSVEHNHRRGCGRARAIADGCGRDRIAFGARSRRRVRVFCRERRGFGACAVLRSRASFGSHGALLLGKGVFKRDTVRPTHNPTQCTRGPLPRRCIFHSFTLFMDSPLGTLSSAFTALNTKHFEHFAPCRT
ncbi:hypothetical protein BC830DRAFT_1118351 [Chytriomyces sp. MP71]|nr:hypothetical protein BC830DRAFT_1118351 [Chytriomyces sp. MP71]